MVQRRLGQLLSVAEKTEQRNDTAKVEEQAVEGEQVAATDTTPIKQDDEAAKLTGFESFLGKVEKVLS